MHSNIFHSMAKGIVIIPTYNEIENIEDMSHYTSDNIIHWKDIGRRTLEELLSTMKSNGIKFKGE